VPWFVTLFGRDSILAAMQTLAYGPAIARDTLLLLAHYQADRYDEYRDAEPGKILHELRRGELAHLGEIPQSPVYYGTVDATMLFLILAAEYLAWSGDLAAIERIRPNLDAALRWMATCDDHDEDGYFDYVGQYENGLVNQAWKDSGQAIVNADGSVAEPPIATVEVQSYAYLAWRQSAVMLRALGATREADEIDRRADGLRSRFAGDFWSDDLDCYVLARQRGGRPAAVVSSNAGQVLWGGIATADHARRTIARLMRDDMFSGWGLRTLSTRERRYDPISYHRGSVWPHDNSLILAGARRYGADDEALRIFDALFAAAVHLPGLRLPEVFCGFARHRGEPPVPYPHASAPQAWAAGALPYMVWTLLGLRPDAMRHRLDIVRPVLPQRLEWIELDRLRVGESSVRLRFERRRDGSVGVDADVHGNLEVNVARTSSVDGNAV
jgi:glycogen debranching enzyme